jgi:hypothetical protein
MAKCPICSRKHKNEGPYCRGCQITLGKDRAEERKRQNTNGNAVKFIHYQGHVIGFFNKKRKLVARYIGMSLTGIPKSKLINLDEYCPGYTRDQIKKFKAAVLKLSQA